MIERIPLRVHITLPLLAGLLACKQADPTPSDELGETSESTSGESEGESESTSETSEGPPPDMMVDPNDQIPPPDAEGCHAIYAQDLLPTFELTIAPEEWAALQGEWANGPVNHAMGLDPNPYHPLAEFRHGEIVITDAQVRLRGNPDFWSVEDKIQLQISFNETNPDGRFLGLRKLLFDAATYNRHMLRDRLGLSIMRDMGIDAPCANNARLDINGEYYGIFTNLEKLDKEFLQRVFVDPDGDLWKRAGWEITTNEETANDGRITLVKTADSLLEVEELIDVEQALRVYAAEAILPDSDGMWAGGLNYYFYDDPARGKFVMLPWDLDNVFERFDDPPDGEYPINPDPVVWQKMSTWGRPWYDIALQDPDYFAYYIAAIAAQVESSYQPDEVLDKIDTWTEQIQDSVFEDPNKPYTNEVYLARVEDLREYVQQRYEFLIQWQSCWDLGGMPDAEGFCIAP
jgi:hypothetical protein